MDLSVSNSPVVHKLPALPHKLATCHRWLSSSHLTLPVTWDSLYSDGTFKKNYSCSIEAFCAFLFVCFGCLIAGCSWKSSSVVPGLF